MLSVLHSGGTLALLCAHTLDANRGVRDSAKKEPVCDPQKGHSETMEDNGMRFEKLKNAIYTVYIVV